MSTASCHVLVVDPSEDIQTAISHHVEGKGIAVTFAPDPVAAAAVIAKAVPDIVMTDVFLPGEDGLVMVQDLKDRHESCHVIVMAQDGSEPMIVRAFRAGAIDYLHKPIVEDELARALCRARAMLLGTLTDMPGVCRSEHRLIVDSDPAHMQEVISWILKTTAFTLSEERRLHLRGALQELLINAAEHGNLEISYRDKQLALAEGRYQMLLEQRLAQERLRTRRIVIDMLYEKKTKDLVYRIADEGMGFGWETMLNRSADACNGKEANGRGMFLVRSFFPDLAYNDRGNEVTIRVPLN